MGFCVSVRADDFRHHWISITVGIPMARPTATANSNRSRMTTNTMTPIATRAASNIRTFFRRESNITPDGSALVYPVPANFRKSARDSHFPRKANCWLTERAYHARSLTASAGGEGCGTYWGDLVVVASGARYRAPDVHFRPV